MEADYGSGLRGRDDPLYAEGLAHVQAGDWTAAVRSFEALADRYPGDPDVVRSLDEARFRARLDKENKVRPKNVNIRWSRVFARVAIIVVLAALAYGTALLVTQKVGPVLAQQNAQRAYLALVRACKNASEGEDVAAARTACTTALNKGPNNEEVQGYILLIDKKEQEQQLCKQAEDLLDAKEYDAALEKFTDIQLQFPGSCKAQERISMLRDRQDLARVFDQCKQSCDASSYSQVIDACEQVRARSTDYQAGTVAGCLHQAYLVLGKQMVELKPPAVDQLPVALDYFTKALAFQPKDADAQTEQQLASRYLAGQQALQASRLDDGITNLAAVVQLRPDYLSGLAAQALYDAYLKRGDQYRDAGDPSMAYRMYDLARQIPGVDVASAINRRDSVVGLLTPTPTPSSTPTETPIPTATAYIPPTVPPPATPAPPLGTFRGKIVFLSDKEGQQGYWVMNPDGTQKRYLGSGSKLDKEYQALREREAYSPDGRFRSYALRAPGDSSVEIYWQGVNSDGFTITQRVTDFSHISYDPVWSPDGSKIAFVSPEKGSDDIFIANPNGKGDPVDLTPNPWEWDKHPSWSPDSRQIVFWSNRDTKLKQIWVMDADGKNVKRISGNADWEEYDPIWIK